MKQSCTAALAILVIACVLSSSCRRRETAMDPQDVISRSIIANHSRENGAFFMAGTFTPTLESGESVHGSFALQGIYRRSFRFLAASGSVTLQSHDGVSEEWKGEFIIELPSKILIRIVPPHRQFNEQSIANGTWWQLSEPLETTMSPDSSILLQQMDGIVVTKDLGREEVEGNDAYHYAVRMRDNEKTTGEVWIDAETFHLKKAMWSIHQPAENVAEMTLEYSSRDSVAYVPVIPEFVNTTERDFFRLLHTISIETLVPKK